MNFTGMTMENHKNYRDTRCPSPDSKGAPPECNSKALRLHHADLLTYFRFIHKINEYFRGLYIMRSFINLTFEQVSMIRLMPSRRKR
jgi:hypothetical protein